VENADTSWTSDYVSGQEIHIPLKNMDGRYVADEHTLDELEAEGGEPRVALAAGEVEHACRSYANIIWSSSTTSATPRPTTPGGHLGYDAARICASPAKSSEETRPGRGRPPFESDAYDGGEQDVDSGGDCRGTA